MYIKHDKIIYEITEEQAEIYRKSKQSRKPIEIDGCSFNAGSCEIISELPRNWQEEYEVKTLDKQAITERTTFNLREFREELNKYKNTDKPIEFYGQPVKDWGDYVINDVIGGCPYWVVGYALDNSIITREEIGGRVYWSINSQYDEFMRKYKVFKITKLND